jgi:hypothetical protein
MKSVSKKTGVSKKAQRDRRILAKARLEDGAERPIPRARIEDTARRAGLDPTHDSTMVTVMRGDLAFAAQEIRGAFDDVLAAELSDDGAQHDVLVLQALRRLRNARNIVQSEIGGAS